MANIDELTGWERSKAVYKAYPVVMPLLWIGIGMMVGFVLFGRDGETGYITNLYTEVLSISVTAFVIDYLNQRREAINREQDAKEQLIRDVSSLVNNVAVNAVHQVHKLGWLTDENGILQGSDLQGANLAGASFRTANLANVTLAYANLNDADLWGANLIGASLSKASLISANLLKANLQNVTLEFANLENTSLEFAILEGTSLEFANLKGAGLGGSKLLGTNLYEANMINSDLWGAEFDNNTILPDGSKWEPSIDLARFTDPSHAEFWRSYNWLSSAYWGNNADE